jgi:two-component system response regulator AlgR
MLKLLISDDEAPARNRLRRMLANVADLQIVGEAVTGLEVLELIPINKPNVLLLDISMPGLDGMTLAQMLQKQASPPAIIFCTAWSDQAVEAFACDAVDYLVKPVRQERLEAALDKARRFLDKSDAASGIFLRSTLGGKVQLLPLNEVICLYSEDKYTMVVHQGGKLLIDRSLLELEKDYANILLRVHRAALVAKNRIRGLDKTHDGQHHLLLEGSEERPTVSRRNLPAVRRLIRELEA